MMAHGLLVASILLGTLIVSWWLSGFDSKVSGEDRVADLKRRLTRCLITVVLMALGTSMAVSGGRFGGFIYLALVLPIALIWVGCVSELFARGFHALIDSHGEGDPNRTELTTDLDRLAILFHEGRNDEAIALASKLVNARDASSLAMETMLFNLYDRVSADERLTLNPALSQARQMCEAGSFSEAESQLVQIVKREPANVAAALMLLRLYTHSLRSPDKALSWIGELERRSGVPPFFVEYLRKQVSGSLGPAAPEEKSSEGIESLLVNRKQLKGQGIPDP